MSDLFDSHRPSLATCKAMLASHERVDTWPEVTALVAAHAARLERLRRDDEEYAWLRTFASAASSARGSESYAPRLGWRFRTGGFRHARCRKSPRAPAQ
jgi:hypothetical protein